MLSTRSRRLTALCALPLALAQAAASAAVQTIEVTSTGNEVSVPLPPGTTEVELQSLRAGNCRFGRTWGYDLSARQMWVNSGCAGVFSVSVRDDAVAATPSAGGDASSNSAAALAAMAAIAGVAILASHGNKHQSSGYYPSGGYYPPAGYPPQGGYVPPPPPPPPPGMYPGGPWVPPPGSRQSIMRHATGACLDLKDGQGRPGTPVNIWDCHGRPNQTFFRTPPGELAVQGLCVEPAGRMMQPGARIVGAPCDRSPIQRWYFAGAQVRNMQTGLCLDVPAPARGAAVIMNLCNGAAPGQRWFW